MRTVSTHRVGVGLKLLSDGLDHGRANPNSASVPQDWLSRKSDKLRNGMLTIREQSNIDCAVGDTLDVCQVQKTCSKLSAQLDSRRAAGRKLGLGCE